jgi:hypothetical protein
MIISVEALLEASTSPTGKGPRSATSSSFCSASDWPPSVVIIITLDIT